MSQGPPSCTSSFWTGIDGVHRPPELQQTSLAQLEHLLGRARNMQIRGFYSDC